MATEYRVRRTYDRELVTWFQQDSISEGIPPRAFDGRAWWVAWCGDQPAGYAAIRLGDDCAWLTVCVVRLKHRRHGLQKRLIRVRLLYAKRRGINVVYTYTLARNHNSARALISQGFRPCTPPAKHGGEYAGVVGVNYWKRDL